MEWGTDMNRRERMAGRGDIELPRTRLEAIKMRCRPLVVMYKVVVEGALSAAWSLVHLGTEFWHPNESYPPQRYKLHFWYACLVLLNRPSKYLGYLEDFFDSDHSTLNPAALECDPGAVHHGCDGGLYRRHAYTFRDGTSSTNAPTRARPTPTMNADNEFERLERWNTEVIDKIVNDWDRYLCVNAAICL